MMKNAGILRRDRFISVTGAELKGQFVGWTAPKVAELFDKNDIILIDEDNINEDKDGSPYIRTLSDIVEYEETNGTVFHTHHASPRRHWVKSHTRHLPNGKETEVQGHWRGKDNKEVIYKLPKRPKSH